MQSTRDAGDSWPAPIPAATAAMADATTADGDPSEWRPHR